VLRNVKEVAEFCGASEKTIWRALWRGELECVRLGRLVRISDEQLETWLSALRTPWPSRTRR
jgi:excisionase family DNA binding protein